MSSLNFFLFQITFIRTLNRVVCVKFIENLDLMIKNFVLYQMADQVLLASLKKVILELADDKTLYTLIRSVQHWILKNNFRISSKKRN